MLNIDHSFQKRRLMQLQCAVDFATFEIVFVQDKLWALGVNGNPYRLAELKEELKFAHKKRSHAISILRRYEGKLHLEEAENMRFKCVYPVNLE